MTSPDGLPASHYNPTQPPRVGDWDLDLDLVGLGDELIFGPIRQLLSAVTGLPLETWPTVPEILDAASDLLSQIGAGIESLLSGVIPLGWLSATTPNMLVNGGFDGAVSMTPGEGWSYDATVGRTKPGAALFTASGIRGVQMSEPVQVAEGQQLDAEVWAKWSGVATSSSSAAWTLTVRWWDGEALLAETVIASKASPAASSDWAKLSGSATTPAGADLATLTLSVEDVVTAGSIWWDDAALRKPSTSIPQQWVTGLLEDIGTLGAWIKDLIERLTGQMWSTIGNALGGLSTWTTQLGTILSGGTVSTPLPSLVGATISTIRRMIEQITGIAKGDPVTPINGFVQDFKDGWGGLAGQISNAVADAVDAAVNAVVDGMNGLGSFAAAITAAISAAINNAIASIFGDGGTKWGQELYVAAGPVTLGFNDVPLGFGMPFSGKITDIQFYSNDHLGPGSVVVETRKNGTVIHTGTWNGGNNSYAASSLNLSVAKGDRITFYVTTVTSQAANMSVSVMGKYV